MRVFYCNNSFDHPQTGGELFYARILSDLKDRPDVDLILPTKTDLRILNRPNGCLAVNRYFFKRFRHLPEGTIVIESEHFHYNLFLATCLTNLCRGNVKFVVQICQLPDPLTTSSRARLIRGILLLLLMRSADRVTVSSQFVKRQMIELGALQERVRVVGVAGQPMGLPKVRSISNSDGCIRLLSVAHIRPLKGQQVLVKALSMLRDRQVELALIGGTKDENYMWELQALIEGLGLTERVCLVGRLEGEKLAQAYAQADIFVLPSLYEAYGIVVQEAMSFELPVVATNVGGIPEQLRDGLEGILVPPRDPKALANALHRLIADARLRARMGAAGRKRAAELPTWDEVCEGFYRVLKGIE